MIPLDDRVGLGPEERAELVALLESEHTLQDVVQHALRAGRLVQAVIAQDEYTHDVVVPFRQRFLVYDAT